MGLKLGGTIYNTGMTGTTKTGKTTKVGLPI